MSIHRALQSPRMRLNALSYANRLWEALDTPVALGMYLRMKYGCYREVAEASVRPIDYMDRLAFQKDYQAVSLLSKYPFLDSGIDRQAVAYEKFQAAEESCRKTNDVFRKRASGHIFSGPVESVLTHATRKIARILGDVPSLDVLDFSFGPGAAFGVRGDTSVMKKVTSPLECTYAFTDTLQEFLEEFPGWVPPGTADVHLVQGSQLIFVPKNAKTDRSICIEPLLNGLYQKGFGSYMRGRLRKFGVDLRDQTINQKLAGLALQNGLATVDLKAASDTISHGLVLDLLPFDWFEALDVARCSRYLYNGVWKDFHKFSSMGNAYTFELETLIFYALACGCCEVLGIEYRTGENLSVYGDDVIIPRDAFDLFHEVLVACGFELNSDKSFKQGLFYESCGHDYFDGYFVRPFLIKKRINTLTEAFYVANQTRRAIARLSSELHQNSETSAEIGALVVRLNCVYEWVVGCVPTRFRFRGPEGFGDGHLISSFDEATPRRPSGHAATWDGWVFDTVIAVPKRVSLTEVPMPYALYFTRNQTLDSPESMRQDGVALKGESYDLREVSHYKRIKGLCLNWHDPFEFVPALF